LLDPVEELLDLIARAAKSTAGADRVLAVATARAERRPIPDNAVEDAPAVDPEDAASLDRQHRLDRLSIRVREGAAHARNSPSGLGSGDGSLLNGRDVGRFALEAG
jgi:hypothetical protein